MKKTILLLLSLTLILSTSIVFFDTDIVTLKNILAGSDADSSISALLSDNSDNKLYADSSHEANSASVNTLSNSTDENKFIVDTYSQEVFALDGYTTVNSLSSYTITKGSKINLELEKDITLTDTITVESGGYLAITSNSTTAHRTIKTSRNDYFIIVRPGAHLTINGNNADSLIKFSGEGTRRISTVIVFSSFRASSNDISSCNINYAEFCNLQTIAGTTDTNGKDIGGNTGAVKFSYKCSQVNIKNTKFTNIGYNSSSSYNGSSWGYDLSGGKITSAIAFGEGYSCTGTALIQDCTFENCNSYYGGAIYFGGSNGV